jgi:excisionase family DNA binding protein
MTAAGIQLLTVVETADRLGISRSELYELIADGALPTVRIGRIRRISMSALEAFVAEHTETDETRRSE